MNSISFPIGILTLGALSNLYFYSYLRRWCPAPLVKIFDHDKLIEFEDIARLVSFAGHENSLIRVPCHPKYNISFKSSGHDRENTFAFQTDNEYISHKSLELSMLSVIMISELSFMIMSFTINSMQTVWINISL
ncbi:hypothetical protein DFH27DRAFT_382214 [Peziza echinospora]|nr:hypothetical protein DFH27DRAFT_382214 [Peziza echinospora]